jgi:ribosomal protein S26
MNVGRRGNTGRVRHEFTNASDIDCVLCGQQMPERISHSVLTFVSRQLQNLHVHFVGHFF